MTMPAPDDVEVLEAGAEDDEVQAAAEDGQPKKPLGIKEVWPLWKLTLVALPQLSVQMLWCFLGPNSAPYMQYLGASNALATANNQAGPITGFFTGPLVGAKSDSLTSRWGRRRPVILLGLSSMWIAGMLFTSAEHIMPEGTAIWFAAPMFWIMDVTINILQTPHRALVADLASDEQQIPMQIVFVFLMSVGNFLGYYMMQLYPRAIEHMIELMVLVCSLNTITVGIQFAVVKEIPLEKSDGDGASVCAPVRDVAKAVTSSPRLMYHLAFVQSLVWIGLTCWNSYGLQWFGFSVYGGDNHEYASQEAKDLYAAGQAQFSNGGLGKAGLQLCSSLIIILILLRKLLSPRLVYAPCIFAGAVVTLCAAFVVGTNGTFAMVCMIFSVMPEVGSFAIPFGLVAVLNKQAEKEGKPASTALQMALLNCCITLGSQVCTLTLTGLELSLPLERSLGVIFAVGGTALAIAGVSALFLDDDLGDDEGRAP